MIAIQPKTRQILGVNQQSYQALKSSMALNLRRQLLIAVCDNVAMQNQLASQLETDLAIGVPMSLELGQHLGQSAGPSMGYAVDDLGLGDQDFGQDLNGQLPRATAPSVGLERLVFDPEDGNLPKQVANWVRQTVLSQGDLPQLQVVGIEQMTRQPAITQNHFLRSLEKVEALLPRLNTSLLIWLPWPWLRTIQQSAPTFWNWRSGIFEFVSDPTPADIDNEVPPLPPIDLSPSEQADFSMSNGADASNGSAASSVNNGANGADATRHEGLGELSDNGGLETSALEYRHLGASPQGDYQTPESDAAWLTETEGIGQQHHSSFAEQSTNGLSPQQASNLYGEKESANQNVEDIDWTAFPQEFSTSDASSSGFVAAESTSFDSASAKQVPPETELLETDLLETDLLETDLLEGDSLVADGTLQAAVDSVLDAPEAITELELGSPELDAPSVVDVPLDTGADAPLDAIGHQAAVEPLIVSAEDELDESELRLGTPDVPNFLEPEEVKSDSAEPELAKPELAEPELAEPELADSPLVETENATAKSVEESLDVELGETAVIDKAQDAVVPSTPTSDKVAERVARRPRRRRRNVGVLGGLRSVVSKGVNAVGASSGASTQVVRSPGSSTDASDGSATSTVTPVDAEAQKTLTVQTAAQQRAARQQAADDYFAVGMVYRTRIENGERGLDLIEPAIAAYEGALGCLSGPHPDWGSGLNDLGTLYWLKAQQLNDPQQSVDCMTHSIQLYQEAIDKLAEPSQPADRQADDIVGQLYSNMGAVYTMLATHEEPTDYLNQAAATYLRALELYTLESDPEEYATLQNSMGSVYWQLSHYNEPIENLRSAIKAYNEALLGYEPARQPLDYAAVQNNVGITYWSLAKHERPTFLLKHAIAAYRDALTYRTPEVDPGACAITYNNLALAYWDLSKEGVAEGGIDMEQKSRYQKNAVTAFEAALNTSQAANSLSQADAAAIFHCLGDVHAQMVDTAPSLTEVSDCLQKSLYSYLKAIEDVPTDSPLYQGRLGAIVANLKSHYDQLGLSGQQSALNRIPPAMLSQVMLAL
ncbi:MAG: hypothetical protein AAGC93_01480 [Cyanobacteria bacterium P01_F01_bin.53]